jgi:flavorubredoxin
VARVLHKNTKSDIEEIKDRTDRSGILGYLRSGKDALFGKEADVEGLKYEINDYNSIFIGGPVWVLRPATPISTMIKRLDLKNKNIILFVTCGGNHGKALDVMTNLVVKNNGNVIHSFVIKTSKVDSGLVVQSAEDEIAKLKEIVKKKSKPAEETD